MLLWRNVCKETFVQQERGKHGLWAFDLSRITLEFAHRCGCARVRRPYSPLFLFFIKASPIKKSIFAFHEFEDLRWRRGNSFTYSDFHRELQISFPFPPFNIALRTHPAISHMRKARETCMPVRRYYKAINSDKPSGECFFTCFVLLFFCCWLFMRPLQWGDIYGSKICCRVLLSEIHLAFRAYEVNCIFHSHTFRIPLAFWTDECGGREQPNSFSGGFHRVEMMFHHASQMILPRFISLQPSGKRWCCKFAFFISILHSAVISFIDSNTRLQKNSWTASTPWTAELIRVC